MAATTIKAQTVDFDFNEMEYTPHQTTFQLFAPADAKSVKVRIYKDGSNGKPVKTVRMKLQETGRSRDAVWSAAVKGDLMGCFYTFDIGYGETPGVFAKAVGVNGRRAAIIDEEKTFPDDWCCDQHPVIKSPADLVVYEMHHRDFSVARPGAKYPGKFLALTEPWAIDHLKSLGVNAVHILPSYDFGSIDETAVLPLAPASSTVAAPSPSAVGSAASSTVSAPLPSAVGSAASSTVSAPSPSAVGSAASSTVSAPSPSAVGSAAASTVSAPSPSAVGFAAALPQSQYNWGYDPVNYNVPEGSYSTNPYDPVCRIREFKQMVQALHNAGIAVILDVVYNHTYDIEHSNFQRTYPDYYYRKTHPQSLPVSEGSAYSNGSGCGNETASEQPMMRRFMIESVKYWYNEYRVDGFRFDLMGCHDIETMSAIRQELDKLNPSIFIYGEGWSAGQCALPTEQLGLKANIPQMPRIAAFSDELRDALRGPFDDDTKPGWLGGAPNCEESLKFGIVGAISHPQIDMTKVNYSKQPWAVEPTQTMAYVSCHDDMCLVDRLQASIPSCSLCSGTAAVEELIRLDLLAQTAVFTSQGVPFMLSGEELLRTKKGVHNSFESPDSINQLDWSNKERYPQVFKYYQDLIALRKHHPAFRLGDAHLVRKHLEFLDAPAGVVAFRLKDYAGRDDWRNIIVILNANRETATVNIPKGMYTVVCQNGEINEQSNSKIFGRRTTVSPQSALILHD